MGNAWEAHMEEYWCAKKLTWNGQLYLISLWTLKSVVIIISTHDCDSFWVNSSIQALKPWLPYYDLRDIAPYIRIYASMWKKQFDLHWHASTRVNNFVWTFLQPLCVVREEIIMRVVSDDEWALTLCQQMYIWVLISKNEVAECPRSKNNTKSSARIYIDK